MTFALIKNGVVVSIEILDATQAAHVAGQYDAVIDVTHTTPAPQIGWTLSGGVLSGPIPVQSWKITKLAMLQRLTVPERMAILAYVSANPASIPAILMQNIQVATFVDLQRPDTIAGVGYLASYGLLTAARVQAILTTVPTALEIYQG